MFKKSLLAVFFLVVIIFNAGEADAECNGVTPINGEDWIIDELTHCWDEIIEVNELQVNDGGLRLENVSLLAHGKITINHPTSWEKSTIIHNSSSNDDHILLQSQLKITGTNLTINAPEDVYSGTDVQGINLGTGSELIITDFDNNPNTIHDASNISSVNWNETDPYDGGIEFFSVNGEDEKLVIQNSFINHVSQISTYSQNVVISNNTFYRCSKIQQSWGDNLTFENNKIFNTTHDVSLRYWGNNSKIINNYVRGNYGGFHLVDSYNGLVKNNTFVNISGVHSSLGSWGNSGNISWADNSFTNIQNYGITLYGIRGANVYNNALTNVSNPILAGGENITIRNNSMDICGWDYSPSYIGGCITLTSYISIGNITVYNNAMTNAVDVGIMVASSTTKWSNITVFNNSASNSTYGILMNTYAGRTEKPNNVSIYDNVLTDHERGIGFSRSYTAKGGDNVTVYDNRILNSSRGITVFGTSLTYRNLIIKDNIMSANVSGIYLDDIDGITALNNTVDSEFGIVVWDSKEILLISNEITAISTGIGIFNSDGNITNNQINGICVDDTCDTFYFSKVGKSGIKVSEKSLVSLNGNIISSFNLLINSTNSNVFIHKNILNFGNVGIYVNEGIETKIIENVISNSSTLIETTDSLKIEVMENNFSNFLSGIHSKNSTIEIFTNVYSDGETCLEFIDSIYLVNDYANFDCNEAYMYERYNINVNILTDDGIPSANHQFHYYNDFDSNKKYTQTNEDGLSNYLLLTTTKVDNAGLVINFNNYYFGYYHNDILGTIELEVNANQTVMAYLDTSAPTTTLKANSSLSDSELISLHFNKTSAKNDLLNFDLYVLKNDGVNFAQWEFVGTYNSSFILYEGEDGTKYRFKVISRDIYGNIEDKEGYDCELEVDVQTPESYFDGINEDYYFTGKEEILLNWNSNDEDIEVFEILVYYNDDTTPNIGYNSGNWVLQSNLFYYQADELLFNLENVGHYGFKLVSKDYAGNQELKVAYDFIVNFDPTSDKLTFADVPERWGEETLEISIDSSNLFLDFSLFIAMESTDYSTNKMTWYEHSEQDSSGTLVLEGLLDRTKYYLYAQSVDLAGNVEDPLNSTEIFASNGQYDQKYQINYIPLAHGNYEFLVSIDNDFDGIYESELERGYNQKDLGPSEYFLDVTNKTIIFGGLTNGGFIPNEDLDNQGNIKVQYSGVHAIIEVYTGNPLPAQGLDVNPTNLTHIVFNYDVPKNSETCKVQLTTNISKGWFNEEIIEPCNKGEYSYVLLNPQLDKEYFFRVMIENEFGQTSYSDSKSVNMDDVVKLYTSTENTETGILGMDSIIPITALVGIIMLSFGGILLYRSNKDGTLDENVNIIESKPVAKYKVEELYLIYKDGRLIRNLSAVEVKTDSDIMSGMLTAINDFVQDSFNTEGDLGSIDYGNNKIILQREKNSYLAAVVYGEIDNYFKGKLINAVRKIEDENRTIENWNGDSSSIINIQKNLEPIIAETESVTREMVDNYFTEKEIAITTKYDRDNNNTTVKINLSNYSSTNITDCKIIPEYNDSLLGLNGIAPTVPYYFDRNTFEIGDIKSYNEVQFTLKMKNKSNDVTTIELKLEYNHKGRISSASSIIEIT